MSAKIAADHLARGAVVYVRQSTMTQVLGNLESQKRQYALADTARAAGFASVTVIDDDLGRSGSGLMALGGRHTEVRVVRRRTGRYPDGRSPSAVEVIRKLGGQWPDGDLAVTMNRMR